MTRMTRLSMPRIQKYVAVAAVAAALAGVPTVSYAAAPGTAAYDIGRHAPSAQIVAPGEHVAGGEPGFELWLTEEGKYWTTPDDPEPQFRSVVDGNIDLSRPGVSVQAEGIQGHYVLSGLYYGGRGTASRVAVETSVGTVQGKLLELTGKPGWGVWYAIADVPMSDEGGFDAFHSVTVHDTRGRVYSQLELN
ncbi:hypothetical protein ACFWFF_36215 [Streptomyces sp. NPDC060223]|uniref:hypothetical protein n=1 Tax=unclassified Streptomyces TaxID=2593676 RepID=UPI00363CF03A